MSREWRQNCTDVKIPTQEDVLLRNNIQGCVSIMTTFQVPVSLFFFLL